MKPAKQMKPATKRNGAVVKHKPSTPTKRKAQTLIRPLSAMALKETLWEVLNDIRTEQMLPNRGDAVASQAREILRTVKTQMQIAGQAKRPIPVEIIEFSERR